MKKMLDKIIDELTPYGECPDDPSPIDISYYGGRSQMIDWLKGIIENYKKTQK